jgi:AcrR family transcriptional regulator
MLEAMARAAAKHGYARTTVADVLAGARVSRETFYQHFANKEECFLAAYDFSVQQLLGRMAAGAAEASESSLERFDRALGAYLEFMIHEPALARVFLIDVYAGGPRVLARRRKVQERFVETISDMLQAETPPERFQCEALVASISSLVTVRVADNDVAGLRSLRAPILGIAKLLAPVSALASTPESSV